MTITNAHPDEGLIHDFVDGELGAEERARIAAHLDACPGCRAQADALVALRESARRTFAGAPHVDARDQWGAIEAAIAARGRARRLSPLAAAASVALLLGVGAALYGPLGGRLVDPRPEPAIVAAPAAATPAAGAAPAAAIAAAYAPALSELEALLARERAALQPETVATVEANLAILNQAIRDIEAALAADPAHRGSLKSLEGMYQTKLGVLRQAVTLTSGV